MPFFKTFVFKIFVVINGSRAIHRFTTKKSLFIFDPFNKIRRLAIYLLTHSLFSAFVIITILCNCFIMAMPPNPRLESVE